jgi:hypothetical protein
MLRTKSERPEDEEIQGALRKIDMMGRHASPFTSTGKNTSFLVEAQWVEFYELKRRCRMSSEKTKKALESRLHLAKI